PRYIPAIKRKEDVITADDEAIAVLNQNMKTLKIDQDTSPAIKRKEDVITADDEAIAVLDQNIKKSKIEQDEPGKSN
ncbi:hypothetical protein OS493_021494, partial [Desmophyllum pertusum]